MIYSVKPKLVNCVSRDSDKKFSCLVESFRRDCQHQKIQGRKSKLLEKRCIKLMQNSQTQWEKEPTSKSQNSKHSTLLKGSRTKLWSTGNWFYAGASTDHNFGELKDFYSDSHKASDTKEHVSSQYHFFRKRHGAIIAFYFKLYRELSSRYSLYGNSWLQFQRNFSQPLKYGSEAWGRGVEQWADGEGYFW